MSAATQLRKEAEAIAESTPPVELPPGLARLRDPFPASQVGKLPKPFKKDAQKGTCGECGKWHGLPAMHLDFVGHGFVTERLLDVDPHWSWEPFALDAAGLPALDRHGNLWIRLTVCGVTRIGVGDGPSMKVLIGDAIRNAAMRFGVALDLWARGSEDEKDEDGETMPEPEPEPIAWNAGMVKAELLNALKGDKAEAKAAWEWASGDDLTEWSAEVAHDIAKRWLERPIEADPTEPAVDAPALPLGETE